MRSGDRRARVRIELFAQKLRAIDVEDGSESCTFATGVDENRIRDIERSVWEGFNLVRGRCPLEGELSAIAGAEVARGLYIQAVNALARLVEKPERLYKLQDFLSARIPENPNPEIPGQVIDVITECGTHLPLESMPLFGTIDELNDPEAVLKGIQRVMPAYRSVIRHVKPSDDRGSTPPLQASWRCPSVRFFQHVHLPGMHFETRDLGVLQKSGKLSVAFVFPQRGFKPNHVWPELDLAERLVCNHPTTPFPRDNSPPIICHFSCHLSQSVTDSVLQMRGRFALRAREYSLEQLRGARAQLGRVVVAPALVFLNTCRSGVADRRAQTSAVEVLSFYEPSCLIGTLADLPDLTAALFSRYFYRTLFDGSSVGDALRAARLQLLDDNRNALGMLYTSYFGEDVTMATESDRVHRHIPDELSGVYTSP